MGKRRQDEVSAGLEFVILVCVLGILFVLGLAWWYGGFLAMLGIIGATLGLMVLTWLSFTAWIRWRTRSD